MDNLDFLSIPESVTTTLEDIATCARHNSSGKLIAAGRSDGWGTIWDLETGGVLRSLEGHTKSITSVSWSRNSRYVLTSSRDWNCVLWDLEEADRVHTIRFDCPVTGAHMNPRNSRIFVATLSSGQCFLVDMRHDRVQRYELDHTQAVVSGAGTQLDESMEEQQPSSRSRDRNKINVARFRSDGTEVYAGTSAGELLAFNCRTHQLVYREKVAGNASIRYLEFDSSGKHLAMASNDRTVRTFEVQSRGDGVVVEAIHKLQDNVAKMPWNGVTWSKNGDRIVGGAASKASHVIYIWDRETGRLEKILDGPREPLLDIDWHPHKSAIATVSEGGLINIWSVVTQEKWGAFAAGFEELEENIVYEEREDEFDIEDEELVRRRKAQEEDQDVDIMEYDDPPEMRPAGIDNITFDTSSSPEKEADLAWVEDDEDDDTVPYYPPVYPEPPDY
ncbi:COMPASS complex protein [Clavulina sp. PMI_390]|nr:COMPASS complex protein [Clavulina sp. PMI_390]